MRSFWDTGRACLAVRASAREAVRIPLRVAAQSRKQVFEAGERDGRRGSIGRTPRLRSSHPGRNEGTHDHGALLNGLVRPRRIRREGQSNRLSVTASDHAPQLKTIPENKRDLDRLAGLEHRSRAADIILTRRTAFIDCPWSDLRTGRSQQQEQGKHHRAMLVTDRLPCNIRNRLDLSDRIGKTACRKVLARGRSKPVRLRRKAASSSGQSLHPPVRKIFDGLVAQLGLRSRGKRKAFPV